MHVRSLRYRIDTARQEEFEILQHRAAVLARRHGLIRLLMLADADDPAAVTEFQVYYDADTVAVTEGLLAADPEYVALRRELDAISNNTRAAASVSCQSLILDVGGAGRG